MPSKIFQLQETFLHTNINFHPTAATALGLKGDHGSYSDFGSAHQKAYLQEILKIKNELSSLEKDLQPGTSDWLEAELLKHKIILEEKEIRKIQTHLVSPSVYVSETLYGLWFLMVRPFAKRERYQFVLERMEKIPDVFKQAKALLQNPPKLWTQITIQEINGLRAFVQECEQTLKDFYPKEKAKTEKLCKNAIESINQFQQFLKKELLKRSDGKFAVGSSHFDFLLHHYHGYSEKNGTLLKLGEHFLEETKLALEEQARKIHPKKSWRKLVDEIKGIHPSQEELLKTYQKETLRVKKFITQKKIVEIPKNERLKLIETPLFARSTIPYAAYIDPPLFGTDRTGTFFVTPVPTSAKNSADKYLREHSHASIVVTALHEGYPGHHLQFVYQANLKSPIRRLFNCSSYYEGWALYCEEMMGEAGFYTPEMKLLQLKDKLWRACRVLVDIRMQTEKISDAEAVRFLSKEAQMSSAAARADVNWYTQSATVPQSYLTGMLKILDLREKAKQKWGSEFSLKRFHEWFLSQGAVPIPLIEKTLGAL